jgi:hypothetical protein
VVLLDTKQASKEAINQASKQASKKFSSHFKTVKMVIFLSKLLADYNGLM